MPFRLDVQPAQNGFVQGGFAPPPPPSSPRRAGFRSTMSFWPRQGNSCPTAVIRTRLHAAQKLWECGVMKPTRVPVPAIFQ